MKENVLTRRPQKKDLPETPFSQKGQKSEHQWLKQLRGLFFSYKGSPGLCDSRYHRGASLSIFLLCHLKPVVFSLGFIALWLQGGFCRSKHFICAQGKKEGEGQRAKSKAS